MRILIVEDEHALAETLADLISGPGGDRSSNADIAENGLDGLELIRSGIYDAVILDVMLPGINGFDILKQIRKEGISTPVLMLTARSELTDRVKGLDLGADYYLTKPFENEELLACLRSILRRPSTMVPEDLQFGDLTLTPSASKLTCGEREVLLSAKELEMMRLLMQNIGQYLSKETLILKIWGYDGDVSSNSAEAYISFLRRKLKLLRSTVQICSARSIGYRLEQNQ